MLSQQDIQQYITSFKEDLKDSEPIDIVRKRIIFGDCAVLNQKLYFDLRQKVAEHFAIHPNEVLVVGSAKLGFSIAPHKRYKPFGNTSDIDVVILSDRIFCQKWTMLFDLWRDKVIWDREMDFKNYLFQGWIRPDKLPNSTDIHKEWWDFFLELTSSGEFGPYKIRGALYKDWHFLESYQKSAVQDCINNL